MLVMAGAAKGGVLAILTRLAAAQLRSRLLGQRIGSFLARVSAEDLAVLKELIEAGRLRPAIDRLYPLGEAADAVRYLGSGQARAKVVITVS
jgi:NADPH:quinone reductase-like Zn-dependent oxidoreductase